MFERFEYSKPGLNVIITIKQSNVQILKLFYSNIQTHKQSNLHFGMSKQLSPKQYIQTRARSLPVYKCYVNKDWEEAHIAQVIVMRRHVNGNVTTGIYLVDLLCLGVKDAAYFFNEPEAELEERFSDQFTEMFEQVDYALAHNIVYAAHDFALEYGIKPHVDFAIAKFILEEDSDAVELVEIEVGQQGKPHLVVRQAGDNADALAKLKKNAGEGNYYYTIGEEGDEDYEEDDDGTIARTLDEIKVGELTVLDARFIDDDALFNEHEIRKRDEEEKLTIHLEASIRALKIAQNDFYDKQDEAVDDDVTAGFAENDIYVEGLTEEQEIEFSIMRDKLAAHYEDLDRKGGTVKSRDKSFEFTLLEEGRNNPLVVSMLFESTYFEKDLALHNKAKDYLERLTEYVTASLSLALVALVKQEGTEPYNSIYNSNDIKDAFPGEARFGSNDVNTYGLIQTLVSVRDNDLPSAVFYYYLAAETEVYSILLPPVQAELLNSIGMELGLDKGEDDVKPTLRIV